MEELRKTRQDFHVSIRRNKHQLTHIAFRNELQERITNDYVASLNISNTPPKLTLPVLIEKLQQHTDDVDIDTLNQHLIQVLKHFRLGQETITGIVTSKIPSMLNIIAELLSELRLKQDKVQNKDKAQHLLRYLFLLIHEAGKKIRNMGTEQLLMLTSADASRFEEQPINKLFFYFATAALEYSGAVWITKNKYLEALLGLISRHRESSNFQFISNSAMTFVRNYISMYAELKSDYPLAEETISYIRDMALLMINHCQYYLQLRNHRPIQYRIEQLLYAVYILNALSEPTLHISEIPYDKFTVIFTNRYRHYSIFKFILKICLRAIKHSEQCAKFLLESQQFVDVLKPSLRINHNEVRQILILLLDYEGAQKILKAEIIIMILDIPTMCHGQKEKIFEIMFKYFQIMDYSTSEAESRIILKKVAQNIQPYSNFNREIGFWKNLILNGYKSHVPQYVKEPLIDHLTPEQLSRIIRIQKGEIANEYMTD